MDGTAPPPGTYGDQLSGSSDGGDYVELTKTDDYCDAAIGFGPDSVTVTYTTISPTQITGTFEAHFSIEPWGGSVPPDGGVMTGVFSTCSVFP